MRKRTESKRMTVQCRAGVQVLRGRGSQMRQGPLIHNKVKQGACLSVGLKRAMMGLEGWRLNRGH